MDVLAGLLDVVQVLDMLLFRRQFQRIIVDAHLEQLVAIGFEILQFLGIARVFVGHRADVRIGHAGIRIDAGQASGDTGRLCPHFGQASVIGRLVDFAVGQQAVQGLQRRPIIFERVAQLFKDLCLAG